MKTALWSLGLAIAFAGGLMFAALPREPEVPMPESWKVWLTFERPRGRFVGESYMWCDGRGFWVVYEANGNFRGTDRACWIFMIPRGLD